MQTTQRDVLGRLLAGVVLSLAFLCLSSPLIADQEIELTQKFTGKIADPELKKAAPQSGIVTDLATWQKLWVAWRPKEPVKEVDFKTQLVLVNTASGPNLVFANRLAIDDQGNLKYETASSRMGGPGFGYLIMVVPKTGIKTVNGKSLDGKPVAVQPAEKNPDKPQPATQPENPSPAPVQPVPELNPPKPGRPGVDPKTEGQEFVKVEIVGRARTIVNAGDSTGTFVAADGIVWELDLQQDEQLREVVGGLGNSLARIKGSLSMIRQRGGLEARVRWIVRVESIQPLGQPAVVTQLPAEPQMKRPGDPAPTDRQPRLNPGPTQPAARVGETPARKGFKQLSIVTSDGQTQLIRADGSVHYESSSRNINSDWTVDPAIVAKLDRFVAETNWDSVPKVTRSRSNDPNEISYTITIETAKNVTRVFIDRSAVPNQPTISRFFGLVSEMSRRQ